MIQLSQFVDALAEGIEVADAAGPTAVNQRSGQPFLPGIGPHSEAATIDLALAALKPARLPPVHREVPYPAIPRQRCDLVLDDPPGWAIEVKMLRLYGNNGKRNDNMLLHLLSPYPKHRSAVTDCEKLNASGFTQRKAVVIFGYESEDFPLAEGFGAFEALARRRVALTGPCVATFENLIHPVHASGHVCGWEILER